MTNLVWLTDVESQNSSLDQEQMDMFATRLRNCLAAAEPLVRNWMRTARAILGDVDFDALFLFDHTITEPCGCSWTALIQLREGSSRNIVSCGGRQCTQRIDVSWLRSSTHKRTTDVPRYPNIMLEFF